MLDGIPLGERHTVFGLSAMVGISVSFLVKNGRGEKHIRYSEVDFRSTREQKFSFLENAGSTAGMNWKELTPDNRNTWLTAGLDPQFDHLIQMGGSETAVFQLYPP